MRDFKKFVMPLVIASITVIICAIAAYSNYQVSISISDGFRFEPAHNN